MAPIQPKPSCFSPTTHLGQPAVDLRTTSMDQNLKWNTAAVVFLTENRNSPMKKTYLTYMI